MQRIGEDLEAFRFPRIIDVKFIADSRKKLNRAQRRIQHNGDVRVFRQLLQEASIKRSLTRAHLTRQQDKSTATTYAVQQMRQCVPVARAHEEVARIYRYGEGSIRKSEVLLIHSFLIYFSRRRLRGKLLAHKMPKLCQARSHYAV